MVYWVELKLAIYYVIYKSNRAKYYVTLKGYKYYKVCSIYAVPQFYSLFFLIIGGGATSNLMLIQGAICWVSVCSRPSLTYAVNVRIFKVHVLILSMRTQTRPRFNVPSERRRK